eukprot:gene34293-biopygen24192
MQHMMDLDAQGKCGAKAAARRADSNQEDPGDLPPPGVPSGRFHLLESQGGVAHSWHSIGRLPWLSRGARCSCFASRNSELMRQARCIRSEASEASECAERLARDKALEDCRVIRRWFEWAERELHRLTVGRFTTELSAQLPRYCARWYDLGCMGVGSLACSWLAEGDWVQPPWMLLNEAARELRQERCAAKVVASY